MLRCVVLCSTRKERNMIDQRNIFLMELEALQAKRRDALAAYNRTGGRLIRHAMQEICRARPILSRPCRGRNEELLHRHVRHLCPRAEANHARRRSAMASRYPQLSSIAADMSRTEVGALCHNLPFA
jgi:hypothetical protein